MRSLATSTGDGKAESTTPAQEAVADGAPHHRQTSAFSTHRRTLSTDSTDMATPMHRDTMATAAGTRSPLAETEITAVTNGSIADAPPATPAQMTGWLTPPSRVSRLLSSKPSGCTVGRGSGMGTREPGW